MMGDISRLTAYELVVLHVAKAYRKYLAAQIQDPTIRMATLSAAAYYEAWLKKNLLALRDQQ